jgi:hypothetical protein
MEHVALLAVAELEIFCWAGQAEKTQFFFVQALHFLLSSPFFFNTKSILL